MRLILVWLINAVALLAVPYVIPSISVDSFTTALVAALDLLRARGHAVTGEVRLHRAVRDSAARDEVRRLCAASDAVVLVEGDLDEVVARAQRAEL